MERKHHQILDVSELLGPATVTGDSRATHRLLDTMLDAFGSAYDKAGRRISEVFCGVTRGLDADGIGTAGISWTPKGAYIAISAQYVRLLERIATTALAMPDILAFISGVESEHGLSRALDVLSNIRGSLFHFLEMEGGKVDPSLKAADLWATFAGLDADGIAQSAVMFTIAHEVCHLRYSGSAKTRDSGLFATHSELARSELPHQLWPQNRSQREEIVADRAALQICLESGHPAGDLVSLALGSVVATIALAVDGWNVDRSAPSDSHPSPFQRLGNMPMFWCAILDARRKAELAGEVEAGVDVSDLERIARAYALGGLLAGRFREGRDKLNVFEETTELWGWLLNAAGFEGSFLHSE